MAAPQAHGVGDVAGACLELVGDGLEHRLLEGDIGNHVAAALPGGMSPAPRACPTPRQCRWARKPCAPRTKKSAPMSCTSTRMCEMDCAPSTSALPRAMRQGHDLLDRHHRAQRVRHLRDGHDLGAVVQQLLVLYHPAAPGPSRPPGSRAAAPWRRELLPGHDVGVVLQDG